MPLLAPDGGRMAANGVTVADVDEDGRLDVLVPGVTSPKGMVALFFGEGDGGFVRGEVLLAQGAGVPGAEVPRTVFYVGGGGPRGLVSGNSNVSPRGLSFYPATGPRTFLDSHSLGPDGSNCEQAEPVALIADGGRQVACLNGVTTPKRIKLGVMLSDAGYQAVGEALAPGARSFVSADFNADGQADLLMLTTTSLTLLGGDGAFGFVDAGSFGLAQGSGAGRSSIAAADFTGDGRLGVAVMGVVDGGARSDLFMVPLSAAGFAAPRPVPLAPSRFHAAVAPAATVGAAALVTCLRGNPTGSWVELVRFALDGGVFVESVSPVTGCDHVASGDFNGDGKPDVVTTGDGRVNVLIALP
ncbi:MAG: VCBS repeat-containing protein [Archangiaceae bacterium]|nr:VCBS repeat-containing protein [Archangiaceae bacterium]